MQTAFKIFILLALAAGPATAQLSLLPYWQYPVRSTQGSKKEATDLLTIELGYWTRLKTKRMEFYPALLYGLNSSNTYTRWGLQVDIQSYPFDFQNDCKCPSFSKQNKFIKKGFFILVGPGLERQRHLEEEIKYIPHIRVGVGQDIGLNNLITISPILSGQINTKPDVFGSSSYAQAMLRITFRWDKKNF